MKITLAILSIILCLWALFRHYAIKSYAQINIPSYMRKRVLIIYFAILSIATFTLDIISLFNLAWYWAILISIPAGLILLFISVLVLEPITQANFTFVRGGTGFSVWSKVLLAIILAIIAICI